MVTFRAGVRPVAVHELSSSRGNTATASDVNKLCGLERLGVILLQDLFQNSNYKGGFYLFSVVAALMRDGGARFCLCVNVNLIRAE